MSQRPQWPIVYVNEDIVVYAQRGDKHGELIEQFEITADNYVEKMHTELKFSNTDEVENLLRVARFAQYNSWVEPTIALNQEALELDPDSSHAHLGLGYAYLIDGSLEAQEQADVHFTRAIELGSDNAQYHLFLGMVNINLNNPVKAQRELERALEMDPNNKEARDLLRQIFNL